MKTIYYSDELHDEFSEAQITPRVIDGSYDYLPKGWWKRFTRFFWYRVVATPLAYGCMKLKFRQKVIGREKLKPYRKTGFFLFGNHTQSVGDAFGPTVTCFPKSIYVIVHPNNVSMPVLGKVTPSLGALPLPGDLDASRNFLEAVQTRLEQGNGICIYPEAHIWPYYTGIRPFPDASFRYPVKYGVPSFCVTNTYQKRFGGVRMVTYVDGPFFPEEDLPVTKRRKALRDRVYETMVARAKNSNVEVVRYIKKEEP